MTALEYLLVLRRRWIYLALGLIAGLVGGVLTAPGDSEGPVRFTATHTLLVDANSPTAGSLNLEQIALLVSTGPVPGRVEDRLAAEDINETARITGEADSDLRSMAVTAVSSTASGAARAADLTADELVAELASLDRAVYDEEVASLREQVLQAQARVQDLNARIILLPPGDLSRLAFEDERNVIDGSRLNLQTQLQTVEAAGPPRAPLRTLEAASAKRVTSEGWKLPESRSARGAILGGLGVLLGALGAMAADRLDSRIRGKEDAERAFDLPVIAEIPPLGGGSKERELLVSTEPASPFVESYRALRTVALFAAAEAAAKDHPVQINGSAPHRAQVILVTSPSAGEGKTTTAAHLAAVLAESEKPTIVISADFRRPRLHEYFGVPREPGLSDVLAAGEGRVHLSELQMTTNFKGVHLIPSGGPVANPAELLTECTHLIAAARQLFDFIVIDTPPLLVANDATELAAEADMVILVAKADRTSRVAARRATEVLRRVEAPLLGVVVSAAHDTPTAYGYYRYRYYADTDQGGGRRRLFRKPKADSNVADPPLREPVDAAKA